MQADINAERDLVILRVPPASIHNPICIRRGIDGTIRDAIVNAIVTVVPHPIAEIVRPVSTVARVADSGLRRRRDRRRRVWTIFICLNACESDNAIIEYVVGR